ncbi:MAG: hypothetical protein KAV87_50115 [Desulfobacteraceae bacterium]|nr:hypothetical protein [Desulfobacteraceae bacterium]
MGDVHDFRTGRIVKCCPQCHYWKDLEDFNFSAFGKYKRAARCRACSPELLLAEGQPTEDLPIKQVMPDDLFFVFEMEGDDDETT